MNHSWNGWSGSCAPRHSGPGGSTCTGGSTCPDDTWYRRTLGHVPHLRPCWSHCGSCASEAAAHPCAPTVEASRAGGARDLNGTRGGPVMDLRQKLNLYWYGPFSQQLWLFEQCSGGCWSGWGSWNSCGSWRGCGSLSSCSSWRECGSWSGCGCWSGSGTSYNHSEISVSNPLFWHFRPSL